MTQPIVGDSQDEQLKSIVANARRLGLIWELRPGTTQAAVLDPAKTSIVLDGDTATLDAYSIIGTVLPQKRIMCLDTGAGKYIVGYLDQNSINVTMRGSLATGAGTLHSITGSQVNIPSLSLLNVSVDTDHMYNFMGTIYMGSGGNAGDSYVFRWRKGTALTGTIVAEFLFITVTSGFTDTVAFDCSYRPSVSDTADYFLSAIRIAGGGTMTIRGDSFSHSRIVRTGTFGGINPEFIAK